MSSELCLIYLFALHSGKNLATGDKHANYVIPVVLQFIFLLKKSSIEEGTHGAEVTVHAESDAGQQSPALAASEPFILVFFGWQTVYTPHNPVF